MKSVVAALIMVLLSAPLGWTQAELLPRIPRRVLFDIEASVHPAGDSDHAQNALLRRVPDFLYSRISELQPVVRVHEPSQAHSVVRTAIDSDGSRVSVALVEAGAEVERFEFEVSAELDALTSFVDSTAAALAPRLGLVTPRVIVVQDSADDPLGQVVRDVVLADQLASRFEFTLWASGLMRSPEAGDDTVAARISIDPLVFDITWFFQRNLGLTGSIWLHYSDFLYFGTTDTGEAARNVATSLFVLPGVGITYRTLQQVSANAGATLYAGPAWVQNNGDVAIGEDRDGFQAWLQPGDSTTVFYSLLMLHGGVGFSLNPRWTLRTRFSISVSPWMLLGLEESVDYPRDGAGAMFQYFSLGVGYRR